jgi:hypothetical protein
MRSCAVNRFEPRLGESSICRRPSRIRRILKDADEHCELMSKTFRTEANQCNGCGSEVRNGDRIRTSDWNNGSTKGCMTGKRDRAACCRLASVIRGRSVFPCSRAAWPRIRSTRDDGGEFAGRGGGDRGLSGRCVVSAGIKRHHFGRFWCCQKRRRELLGTLQRQPPECRAAMGPSLFPAASC